MADIIGRFGYLYKGVYYVRDRPWLGEPENLGAELVDKIPTNEARFKQWVYKAQRILVDIFRKMDDVELSDESGVEEDPGLDSDFNEEEWYFEGFHPDIPEDVDWDMAFFATDSPMELKGLVSWMYIYDLDNFLFSVEECVHFRLDNVPRGPDGLNKYMYRDGAGRLCRSPSTPLEHITHLHPVGPPSTQEREDIRTYELARPRKIETSCWTKENNNSPAVPRKLAMIIAEGVISGEYSSLSNAAASVRDGYIQAFCDLAKDLLTAAAPCGPWSNLTTDDELVRQWVEQLKVAHYAREKKEGNTFWFRGRFILITTTLSDEVRFKSAVGLVIRRTKELLLESCTAILWSMDYIVVVIITDGDVSCSDAIPVVAAFGRDEDQLREGLSLIAHYLPPPLAERNQHFSSRLPLDIFDTLFDFVDLESAERLGNTCKALRYVGLQHPRIGKFALLKNGSDVFGFLATNTEEGGDVVNLQLKPPECIPHEQWTSFNPTKDSGVLAVHRKAQHYFPHIRVKYQLSVSKTMK